MRCQLSISILVSNHIDTVRKCLESIKPLLTDLRAELIVVDTGSTDGSIEIVKEYTDKIIPFAWCNDFSAARNVGLRAASGEWFLYLDDDEWFEDVDEIIYFFQQEKYMDYGRAFYVQRNYSDLEGKNYSDFYVCRMFQIVQDIHFKYRIHEFVSPEIGPLKVFDSYVHHYGYIGNSEEKSRRNIPLLELELVEKPQDMRMLTQLMNEYVAVKEYSKILELKEKLDSIERGSVNDVLYCYAQAKMAEVFFRLGRVSDAVQHANWLLKEKIHNVVTEAYLYIVLITIYLDDNYRNEDFVKRALQSFEQYMRCINNQTLSKEEFSQTDVFGMGKIFLGEYVADVIKVLNQNLQGQDEKEMFERILQNYNIRLQKESVTNTSGNVADAIREMQEIKEHFMIAIQTLLDKGQLDVALQAINQAMDILSNDSDIQAVKSMIEEEIGQ